MPYIVIIIEAKLGTCVAPRFEATGLGSQDRWLASSLPGRCPLRFDLPGRSVAYAQPRNSLDEKQLNLKSQIHHPLSSTICLYLVN